MQYLKIIVWQVDTSTNRPVCELNNLTASWFVSE